MNIQSIIIIIFYITFNIYKQPQEEIENSIGMKLKLIYPSEFWMGGTLKNETPIHRVKITEPFYIGKYEVTQEQYIKVMGHKPVKYNGPNIPVGITWNEAVEFCNKLSEMTGDKYRLPTEAEWEFAARGGQENKVYVWGNNKIPLVNGILQANVPDESLKKKNPTFKIFNGYNDGFEGLAPVGSFAPNGYGLYDMAGNAWERCSDWYDEYYYSYTKQKDPTGPKEGTKRVMRGGGCWYNPDAIRLAARCGSPMDRCGSNDGFRVVMEV